MDRENYESAHTIIISDARMSEICRSYIFYSVYLFRYFVGPNMNSHNHPALTSIGAWLWRWFAGIRIAEEPSEDGFGGAYAHMTIAPYEKIVTDHARINSVKANLPTTHGAVSLAWEFDGSSLHINCTLPPNTAATVKLPSSFDRSWVQLIESNIEIYRVNTDRAVWRDVTVEGVFAVHELEDSLHIRIGGGEFSVLLQSGQI